MKPTILKKELVWSLLNSVQDQISKYEVNDANDDNNFASYWVQESR